MGKLIVECAHAECTAKRVVKVKSVHGVICSEGSSWYCCEHSKKGEDLSGKSKRRKKSNKPRFRKCKAGEKMRVSPDGTTRE